MPYREDLHDLKRIAQAMRELASALDKWYEHTTGEEFIPAGRVSLKDIVTDKGGSDGRIIGDMERSGSE